MAAIFWKFSSVPGPRITWRDWEESRMWPLSSQVVKGVPHSWFLRVNCYLESYTIDDFAEALRLTSNDLHNLKLIFHSVEQGDLGVLSAIGVKVRLGWLDLTEINISILFPSQDSELGDMKFFIDKLIRTGFLDSVWNGTFLKIFPKLCLLSILVKPTFMHIPYDNMIFIFQNKNINNLPSTKLSVQSLSQSQKGEDCRELLIKLIFKKQSINGMDLNVVLKTKQNVYYLFN